MTDESEDAQHCDLITHLDSDGNVLAVARLHTRTVSPETEAMALWSTLVVSAIDLDEHAFDAQAVDGPVYIATDPAMLGMVRIVGDSGATVAVLSAGQSVVVPCADLGEITYRFSSIGADENFGVAFLPA